MQSGEVLAQLETGIQQPLDNLSQVRQACNEFANALLEHVGDPARDLHPARVVAGPGGGVTALAAQVAHRLAPIRDAPTPEGVRFAAAAFL